jgi:glycosyltransferase involved in cell wall biosynthesis
MIKAAPMTKSNQKIAYLAGEYPAVSHTFILREVAALRAGGLDVVTASVRRTGPEHHRGPDEKAAAKDTFNILSSAKKPLTLLRAQKRALTHPKRYFRALFTAWKMRSPGFKAAAYQIFYFIEATVLADHMSKINVTHLHNHFTQGSCTVALLAAELTDIPFSISLHGPADFVDPKRWRLDLKIGGAKFVACISHFCRSQGMIHAHVDDWEKLKIVHCGVAPGLYGRDQEREAGKTILFVGRLSGVKGVPVLLAAMPDILAAHPDARLVLVGDGPERARLEALAKPLGHAVHFTGYQSQSEVAQLLADSDVFALPSFAEGVPVVLMEAMASQKAVVTTQIAGIPELVEDGTSGRIVAPGDQNALSTAIIDLLSDPARRQAFGVAGRKKVVADFNIETEAAKLASLFLA